VNASILDRFRSDTADHLMTIAHDDGLYRHLQFRRLNGSMYWFDVITAPGVLIFQGDGDAFVWRRVTDMFEFFRGPVGRANPHYWEEKLVANQDRATRYDEDLLTAHVVETVRLSGLPDAVQAEIFDQGLGDESHDLQAVMEFRYWINPDDEVARPHRAPDFEFNDAWEWTIRGHHWWYLWACHAIVWAIAEYDVAHGRPHPGVYTPPAETADRTFDRLLPVAPATAPRVVTKTPTGGVL
jgi:hypothetical protein